MTLTAKQQRFVEEYPIDFNATQAAIWAGYSKKTAHVIGPENLGKPAISAAIAKAQKELSERSKLDIEAIRDRLSKMILADPNELSSIVVSACRYCHGEDHAYQWKTDGEYQRALDKWTVADPKKRTLNPPINEGGVGYSWKLAPNDNCPEC